MSLTRLPRLLLAAALLYGFLRIGEGAASLTGAPLPGSVLGMVLLWGALEAGIVRLAWLQDGAGVLLGWLGLLFVPAGVGFVAFLDAGWVWGAALAVSAFGGLVTVGLVGLVVERGVRRG
ncbi:MAG: CidA/LrgA family protein [Solirubrobacterales bacterium]|nr:CidA/LrgA family protein [Solirubrobacterales bacterium]